MLIAGRQVKIGDSLYHKGLESWGVIARFDPTGSAEFHVKGPKGTRKVLAQSGGVVNSRRQLYWHQPLTLDLDRRDVSALQRVVDILAKELVPKEEGE